MFPRYRINSIDLNIEKLDIEFFGTRIVDRLNWNKCLYTILFELKIDLTDIEFKLLSPPSCYIHCYHVWRTMLEFVSAKLGWFKHQTLCLFHSHLKLFVLQALKVFLFILPSGVTQKYGCCFVVGQGSFFYSWESLNPFWQKQKFTWNYFWLKPLSLHFKILHTHHSPIPCQPSR